MGEPYRTMAEIERAYPNEWVLIDAPTTDGNSLEVTGGHVVLHCADRVEFLRRVGEWNGSEGKLLAVRYAGTFPEDAEETLAHEPGAA
jgi:hypothetical protein